jgi:membrane-associated phospholipid phosphatase
VTGCVPRFTAGGGDSARQLREETPLLLPQRARLAQQAKVAGVSESVSPSGDVTVPAAAGGPAGAPDGQAAADRSGGRSPERGSAGGRQPRCAPPLLAASARPWAGALLACCAILVATLGVVFADQATADRLDHAVDSQVIAWFDGHRWLLPWLAMPGSYIPAAAATAAIVLACLLAGRLNGAVLGAVALPVAIGLNDGLLKHLVHRTYLGTLTYPSGHSSAVFALAATVTVLLVIPPRPTRARVACVLIAAAAFALGIVVAIAVIGLRWHYFTDTVAGAAVGIGTVCGLAFILDLPAPRRWITQAGRRLPLSLRTRAAAGDDSGSLARR